MKCTKKLPEINKTGRFQRFFKGIAFFVMAFVLFTVGSESVQSNDSAVESGAGGLQPREEHSVSIVKERLYIGKQSGHSGPSKLPDGQDRYPVIVEYEFLNESAQDVTTEVAFPLPEFKYPFEDPIQDRKVSGFRLEVDGKVIPHATQIKAKIGDRDVTDLLREARIDIESFGDFSHIEGGPSIYQVAKLPQGMQARLKAAHVVDDNLYPLWSVAISYYWKQTFPAGKIIKIKHEYDAIAGFSYGTSIREYLSEFNDGCFDKNLILGMESSAGKLPKSDYGIGIYGNWVKYILTTANTWKKPIREFELIVDKPTGEFVSFCWEGQVEKLSKTRFRATARDFVPKQELVVYFLFLTD